MGLVHWKKKNTSRPPNSQSSIPLYIIQYKYFFYFIFTHKSEKFSQFYFSANLRSLFHFIPIYLLISQDIVTNPYDIFFFEKYKWQDCNPYDKIRVTRQDHSVMRLAGFERQISPPSPIKKEQLPIYNHREVPAAAGSSFYNHRELLARSSLLFENDISSKLANVSRYVFDSLPLHFIPVKAQSTYFLYISSNISISFILFSHTNPKIFPNFTLVQV